MTIKHLVVTLIQRLLGVIEPDALRFDCRYQLVRSLMFVLSGKDRRP
jgi:hypothetical protein